MYPEHVWKPWLLFKDSSEPVRMIFPKERAEKIGREGPRRTPAAGEGGGGGAPIEEDQGIEALRKETRDLVETVAINFLGIDIFDQSDWYRKLKLDSLLKYSRGTALRALFEISNRSHPADSPDPVAFNGDLFEIMKFVYPVPPPYSHSDLDPHSKFDPWVFWLFRDESQGSLHASKWENLSCRLDFVRWLQRTRNLDGPARWYAFVNHQKFKRANQGARVGLEEEYWIGSAATTLLDLPQFAGSFYKVLAEASIEVCPWKFCDPSERRATWQDKEMRRYFFAQLASHLQIREPSEWYSVTPEKISSFCRSTGGGGGGGGGGDPVSDFYGGSLHRACSDLFPEFGQWIPWLFDSGCDRGFWKSRENRAWYFGWLGRELGIREPEQWYQISARQLRKAGRGGALVMSMFRHSLHRALQDAFPQHEWLPWKFRTGVGKLFWDKPRNRKLFLDWAAKKLGLASLRQFYSIGAGQIRELGGGYMLAKYYNGSLSSALRDVYTNEEDEEEGGIDSDDDPSFSAAPDGSGRHSSLCPWLFPNRVQRNFWTKQQNRRSYFDWLASQVLGIRAPEDWFERISRQAISDNHGSGLLAIFSAPSAKEENQSGVVSRALIDAYPEHEQLFSQTWRFQGRVWTRDESAKRNLERYMDYLSEELMIENLDDWYRISISLLQKSNWRSGVYSNIVANGGLLSCLRKAYPHHGWDQRKMSTSRARKCSQRMLWLCIKKIFPGQG